MKDEMKISGFYGVAGFGAFSRRNISSFSRRPLRRGSNHFMAVLTSVGIAFFISPVSKVLTVAGLAPTERETPDTLCRVHTATPVRLQCAGSPLDTRLPDDSIGIKTEIRATPTCDLVRDEKTPDRV
jgi:hypothetical protein